MFLVSDELHDESAGQFTSLEDAVVEVRRLAAAGWAEEPNRAPCTTWRTCGRDYAIVEFDDSAQPWLELKRLPVLSIRADSVRWASEFEPKT